MVVYKASLNWFQMGLKEKTKKNKNNLKVTKTVFTTNTHTWKRKGLLWFLTNDGYLTENGTAHIQIYVQLVLTLFSQIRRAGKRQQAPCVNSCCAYLFWGLALSSDGAASPGKERRKLSSFPPWCSRRTHRGRWHHDRKKQPLRKRWNTWRAMPARNPSCIPNSTLHYSVAPNRLEENKMMTTSHINPTFPPKIKVQVTSSETKQKTLGEKNRQR